MSAKYTDADYARAATFVPPDSSGGKDIDRILATAQLIADVRADTLEWCAKVCDAFEADERWASQHPEFGSESSAILAARASAFGVAAYAIRKAK